jgi:hypothetical protein
VQKTFHGYGWKGGGMKKNIVKIDYLGITFKVDANESWNRIQSLSIEEQRGSVLTDLHFLIHLHDIDLPLEIRKRFFKNFTNQAARKARDVAIDGLIYTNYEREFLLLHSARDFFRERAAGKFKGDHMAALGEMTTFAIPFAEIIESRDTGALRRMIAIIESKRIPDGSRGGVGSEEGYMLEKFCELHLATRSLPTKKALREACGLGDLSDEKLASKRIKKLGLWGLPTEPEI